MVGTFACAYVCVYIYMHVSTYVYTNIHIHVGAPLAKSAVAPDSKCTGPHVQIHTIDTNTAVAVDVS